MNIRNKLAIENNEFLDEWKIKRKVGLVKYIINGIIKFALFSITIQIGSTLINNRIEFNWIDGLIIAVISIFAPIVGWLTNEYRYKKFMGKNSNL